MPVTRKPLGPAIAGTPPSSVVRPRRPSDSQICGAQNHPHIPQEGLRTYFYHDPLGPPRHADPRGPEAEDSLRWPRGPEGRELRDAGRRARRDPGSLGRREDDPLPVHPRRTPADGGGDPDRRPGRGPPAHGAAGERGRVPELRAVSPPHGRREQLLRAPRPAGLWGQSPGPPRRNWRPRAPPGGGKPGPPPSRLGRA